MSHLPSDAAMPCSNDWLLLTPAPPHLPFLHPHRDPCPVLSTPSHARSLNHPLPCPPILSSSTSTQVMMMPLLSEMPRVSSEAARRSAKDLNRASAITILLTSGLTYWIVGFFGAAM